MARRHPARVGRYAKGPENRPGAATRHRDDVWHEEAAILRDVVAAVPGDFAILRMAVQAGKFAEDAVLIERALAGIEAHFPDALDAAREFVEN